MYLLFEDPSTYYEMSRSVGWAMPKARDTEAQKVNTFRFEVASLYVNTLPFKAIAEAKFGCFSIGPTRFSQCQ